MYAGENPRNNFPLLQNCFIVVVNEIVKKKKQSTWNTIRITVYIAQSMMFFTQFSFFFSTKRFWTKLHAIKYEELSTFATTLLTLESMRLINFRSFSSRRLVFDGSRIYLVWTLLRKIVWNAKLYRKKKIIKISLSSVGG